MEKRYLYPTELQDRWQAMPFEIVDAIKKGLPLYHEIEGRINYLEILSNHRGVIGRCSKEQQRGAEKKIEDALYKAVFFDDEFEGGGMVRFKLTDVEEFEKKCKNIHALNGDIQKIQQRVIPVPDGTKWRHIDLRVVKDTRIEISTPDDDPYISYKELKLDTNARLAKLLERLAGKEKITTDEKQDISGLRKIIKNLFPNIEDDPIPYKGGRYQTAFGISFIEE